MSDKISDALSIRANVSEATIWLMVIFSWLTPYEWYVDLFLGVLIALVNFGIVKAAHDATKIES